MLLYLSIQLLFYPLLLLGTCTEKHSIQQKEKQIMKRGNSTSYGYLYYIYTFIWCWYRGISDGIGNTVETLLRCCYRHRRYAVLPENLAGKTVVITGANGGIGKETARACARLGAKVIFACRNYEAAHSVMQQIILEENVKAENLVYIKLDLSSLASVRNCAAEIADTCEYIDVLINNGGVMMCPEWKTTDGFEYQFGTNFLGHFLLTNLLLPKLKAAPSARIVNITSIAFMMGYPHFENLNLEGNYSPLRSYSRSKLAQMLNTYELAKRLKDTSNVTVYSVHPGVVDTGITKHLPCYLRGVVWFFKKLVLISPEKGAQTTLHCAFNEDAGRESGFYYENCKRLKKMPPHGTDDADSLRLWDLSMKLSDAADHNNNV